MMIEPAGRTGTEQVDGYPLLEIGFESQTISLSLG
jgi:hypothetical protein